MVVADIFAGGNYFAGVHLVVPLVEVNCLPSG